VQFYKSLEAENPKSDVCVSCSFSDLCKRFQTRFDNSSRYDASPSSNAWLHTHQSKNVLWGDNISPNSISNHTSQNIILSMKSDTINNISHSAVPINPLRSGPSSNVETLKPNKRSPLSSSILMSNQVFTTKLIESDRCCMYYQ
jgi:hypothetical protein